MRGAPRICFVETQDFAYLAHRIHLGRALVAGGAEVHVLAPGGAAEPQLRSEGVTYHRLAMQRDGMNPATEVAAVTELWKLYRAIRPDLVHHFGLKPVMYGAAAARTAGISAVVGTVTGLGYSFIPGGARKAILRGVVSLLVRMALRDERVHTIFQNPDDLGLFVSKRLVAPGRTSLILGSGVDTEHFSPAPEPEGPFTVVTATRILRDKGIFELVEAVRLLRAGGLQVTLKLAGMPDPANPASLSERELRAWHTAGALEWLGQVTDIAGLLRDSHLACLPSYREGLPLFLAEAAAAGRAAVTTDVPGCRSVVVHGKTGLLVEVRNSRSLATGLRKLLLDQQLRGALAHGARALAVAEFSREVVVRKTLAVYRTLLGASALLPTPTP